MNYINWIRKKVGRERIFLNFAGACVTNEDGQILLQRRSDKNMWGFPGGAMELGESAEEAAAREVFEETGLHIKTDYLIGLYTKYFDEYPNGDQVQSILFFFKAHASSGDLKAENKETLELRYFDPEHIPPLVNIQHEDCLQDYLLNRRGIYR